MRNALVGLVLSFGVVFGIAAGCASRGPRASLVTTGERTRYATTGRYAEAVQLCRDFARAYAGVHCDEIGRTGQDRPIVAVRIARRPGLPVVMIEAGIHAGEIEGKDAGFAFLRDLLDGKVAPGALDAVAVVFVPVINPDGHERFGANHRVNQRGPAEMGFRTNAARLNINRDFVKAETPELHAVLEVLRRHDPVLFIDLHATDGAKFEHDISINTAPIAARPGGLERDATALSAAVTARLTALGHLPVEFYPSFIDDKDPLSGFEVGEAPLRFSHFYVAARGRLGLLVETHSWRTYPERVASTYHTLQAVFELAVAQAPTWRARTAEASRAEAQLAGQPVALTWRTTPARREIAFRGYAFERRPSELSNQDWLVYDERTPQVWRVPLGDQLVPAVTLTAPRAGYIIDGGFARAVAARLDLHGIAWQRIAGEPTLEVEAFRARKVAFAAAPVEGHTRATVDGAWATERRTLEHGAIFVPIAQPLARIAMHLFEPALPDSLAQWGVFNACFERKEYMEPYVAEEVARALLAADPGLRAQFDAALAADPELAKSSAARLDWFYRRHPSWDERVNLLPVYRVATAPVSDGRQPAGSSPARGTRESR